jgi:hypothetical protein
MRIIPIFLLSAALLLGACNPGPDSAKAGHDHPGGASAAAPVEQLALNNGAKWLSDASTRSHAAQLEGMIDAFGRAGEPDVRAYQGLAASLQEELDRLVGDCRMKGPEHDALHHWLEPVLQDVSALKQVSSVSQGAAATAKLSEDVKKFNQFFD